MKRICLAVAGVLFVSQAYASQNPEVQHHWRNNREANACIFEYVANNGFISEPLLTFIYLSDKYRQEALAEQFPAYRMFAVSEFHWKDGPSNNAAAMRFTGMTRRLVDKPQDTLVYLDTNDTMQLLNTFKAGDFVPVTVATDGKVIHMTPSAEGFEKEYAKFHDCVHAMKPEK